MAWDLVMLDIMAFLGWTIYWLISSRVLADRRDQDFRFIDQRPGFAEANRFFGLQVDHAAHAFNELVPEIDAASLRKESMTFDAPTRLVPGSIKVEIAGARHEPQEQRVVKPPKPAIELQEHVPERKFRLR